MLFFGAPNSTGKVSAAPRSSSAVPTATFPGTGTGAIPDATLTGPGAWGTPLVISYAVTGITAPISTISLDINATHTFAGDLDVVLRPPGGTPAFVIFSRIGATTAGSFGCGTNFGGVYNFADTATTNIWTACTGTTIVPGNFRTTVAGPTTSPAAFTNFTAAFSGLSTAQINGTWTLTIRDGAAQDTGTVSASNLTITGGAAVPADANVDMDGDGKTDYVVARGTLTPLTEATAPGEMLAGRNLDNPEVKGRRRAPGDSAIAPPIYWYTAINGSGVTGIGQLGDAATDFITPEDFDGDGKDDLAVWTEAPATQANFKILQSTTNTVRVEFFGQTGDDPAVVGDYDGDNKADPAVYRCPAFGAGDGQCYFFYRGSNANPGGNVTYVPWGFGEDGDFFPYVGDMDGDGKHDFTIQRANPASPTNGQFVMLKSTGGVEYVD
ncbi:MAG TPA: VCBS repeat-containing protein, partial [Pyrinomonadaceae bacterium]|nr:VCBS repeat-containing protein [Pyrinomonadaceae bacterium]